MARPPDPKRRQELLDGAVDYVVANKHPSFSIISGRKSTSSRRSWAEYAIDYERSGVAPKRRLIARAWELCGRGCPTPTKVR